MAYGLYMALYYFGGALLALAFGASVKGSIVWGGVTVIVGLLLLLFLVDKDSRYEALSEFGIEDAEAAAAFLLWLTAGSLNLTAGIVALIRLITGW